jgi:hypothetical protein
VSAPAPASEKPAARPLIREEVFEESETTLAASQKDNSREVSARISAMRPVQWAGFAALAFAGLLFWPPARIALGGGKQMQPAFALGGLVLVFAPQLLAGNEKLILAGVAVVLVAAWGLSRLAYKEGQADSAKVGPGN